MMLTTRLPRCIEKILLPLQRIVKRGAKVAANQQISDEKVQTETDEISILEARPYEDIPGPKPWPIVGNTLRFLPYIGEYGKVPFLELMKNLQKKYGDMFKIDNLGSQCFLFICDQKLIEKMYRQQGVWPYRISGESVQYYRERRDSIYKGEYGLLVSQGKKWHDFRSKVNQHMLQPRAIRPHVGQIDKVTEDLLSRIRDLRDAKTLEVPSTFNNELNKWALESICSIALNQRLGCLEPNLASDSDPQKVIDCVRELVVLMFKLDLGLRLWRMFPTPKLKRMFEISDTLNESEKNFLHRNIANSNTPILMELTISLRYINQAKRNFAKNPSENTQDCSVLEKLMQMDEHTALIMALDMFMAGVDTTSTLVTAFLYFLATNGEKQEKLRKEAEMLLPTKHSPVTADVLNQASYLKACIKESLRLFPVVTAPARTMPTDIVLNGYRIPQGVCIIPCHGIISLLPENFPRPDEFIPERWLKNSGDFPSAKTAHPYTYMPFGFGARMCIGKRFAEMETEVLGLKMVRNFKLEWHHGPLKYRTVTINTITTPLQLKIIDL